jgi:uncharacterized phage protein (TIGR02218 family)
MRVIATAYQTALDSGYINSIFLLKIFRRDGKLIGITNHDETINFAGLDYVANPGMDPTAITILSQGGASDLDINTLATTDIDFFNPTHIAAGLFDRAETELYFYDIGSTFALLLQRGVIGDFQIRDGIAINMQLKGLATRARERTLVDLYSTIDRAKLGDDKNKLDINNFTYVGEVTGVSTTNPNSVFTVDISASASFPAGWFNNGQIRFTSGANYLASSLDGFYEREIRAYTTSAGGTVYLHSQAPFPVSAGVTFEIVEGYDGSLEQARDKFDNVINFRGEPFIPGLDKVGSDGSL